VILHIGAVCLQYPVSGLNLLGLDVYLRQVDPAADHRRLYQCADFDYVKLRNAAGLLLLEKVQAFLERDKQTVLVALVQLLSQQLNFLLHLGCLLSNMRDTSDVRLQQLIHVDFLLKFKLAEVLLKTQCLSIVLDSVELEVQDVRRVFDPVFVDTHFVGACLGKASDVSAAGFLPVVKEPSILNVEDHWAHLLTILADEALLTGLFVAQLRNRGILAEEVFIDRVGVGLLAVDGLVLYWFRMNEVALIKKGTLTDLFREFFLRLFIFIVELPVRRRRLGLSCDIDLRFYLLFNLF